MNIIFKKPWKIADNSLIVILLILIIYLMMDKKLNLWFIFKFSPLHKNIITIMKQIPTLSREQEGGGALIQGRGLIVEHGPLFKEI